MPQISVRYDDHGVYQGVKKVSDGLPQLSREAMDGLFDEAKYEVSGGYSGGNTYNNVPELYAQSYERTGNLGRSTYWERHGLTYKMYSNAIGKTGQAYSEQVLGNASGGGQGSAFIGRWPNFMQTMTKWREIGIQRMKDALDRLIGGAPGL